MFYVLTLILGLILLYIPTKKLSIKFTDKKGLRAAFLTSLPEISIALISAFFGFKDILLGTLLGSSITLIFIGFGVPALIKEIDITYRDVGKKYLPLLVVVMILALILGKHMLLDKNLKINNLESLFLVIISLYLLRKTSLPNLNKEVLFLLFFILIGALLSTFSIYNLGLEWSISSYFLSFLILGFVCALPEINLNIEKIEKTYLVETNVFFSVMINIALLIPLCVIILDGITLSLQEFIDVIIVIFIVAFSFPFITGKDEKIDHNIALLLIFSYILYIISLIYINIL